MAIDLGILDRKELREEFEAVVRRSQEPPDLFTNCGSNNISEINILKVAFEIRRGSFDIW